MLMREYLDAYICFDFILQEWTQLFLTVCEWKPHPVVSSHRTGGKAITAI